MNDYRQKKEAYIKYLSEAVRYALRKDNMPIIPDATYWVVQPWSFLAQQDFILGFAVLVADMPMAQEFVLATPAEEPLVEFKKAFNEYLSLYAMKEVK